MNDAVHQHQFVSLSDADAPVLSRFSYSAAEPFGVVLSFQAGDGTWVEWSFARDLLIAGLIGPVGEGDVRIRPELARDEQFLAVEFESPGGYAVVELLRVDVETFIDAAAAIVPIGAEEAFFDVDALIEELTDA
ncbi:SsgA family sporulation/cell division regulator [Amycolatopsis albispora]|uniref:Sporulation protein SsgA n=1 Tax=Amycolatopsis albispora TaxID=1804986 RepID=A0A344L4Y0_9PSEU|nr:SsgA family sporulation/cell division regulator [Amycolatopsis albispora]AXB43104.1 sporulation protein SsgA [Amycolatopsis albispora]